MSSAEIEVHLAEKGESFTIRVKLDDPNMCGDELESKAREAVAIIMSAITEAK